MQPCVVCSPSKLRKIGRVAAAFALAVAIPPPEFYAAIAAETSTASFQAVRSFSPARAAVLASLEAALSMDSASIDRINPTAGLVDLESPADLPAETREKIRLLFGPIEDVRTGVGRSAPIQTPYLPPERMRKMLLELRRVVDLVPIQALMDDRNREKILSLLEESLPIRADIESPIKSRILKLTKLLRREARLGYPSDERGHGRRQWEEGRSELMPVVQDLSDRLVSLAAGRESTMSPERFKEALDQNKIVLEEQAIGKAEMTSLDGARITRVAHMPTQLSFVVVDSSKVALDSAHLRRFVARQLIDAGKTRWDLQEGRDTILVIRNGGKEFETKFVARPKPWTRAWWRANWDATWKKPTLHDLLVPGLFWGTVQAVLMWILVGIKLVTHGAAYAPSIAAVIPILGWSLPVPWTVVFTFGYGMFFGTINSAYNNWNYRGRSRFRQLIKGAVFMSLPFALAVIGLDAGFGVLSPLTLAGWWGLAHLAFNIVTNNIGKVAWYRIPQIGRANQRYIHPLPFFGNRANFASQSYYTVNWFFRLFDLIFPWWISMPLFLAGIVVANWLTVRFAEKNRYPEAVDARRQWERILNPVLWVFGKLGWKPKSAARP